ncbi:MAG: hypothetical protein AB7N53_17600 [Candidatus Binatia bacterium]
MKDRYFCPTHRQTSALSAYVGITARWALAGLALIALAWRADALVIETRVGPNCGDGTSALASVAARGITWRDGSLYFADTRCQSIRRLSEAGYVATVAGSGVRGDTAGVATRARLTNPVDVTRGGDGLVYWAEQTRLIRRVASNGNIEDVADLSSVGGTSAIYGLSADRSNIYIADAGLSRIFRIPTPCAAPCAIVPFAGTGGLGFGGDGGSALQATLQSPLDVFAAPNGDVFIADTGNHRIRRVRAGIITTVAGTLFGYAGDGGPATSARLAAPNAVAARATGEVLIADTGNDRIREIDNAGTIRTIAGNGQIQPANLPMIMPADVGYSPLNFPIPAPRSIAVDDRTRTVYVPGEDSILAIAATRAPMPKAQDCDITGDNSVSALDAVQILSYIAGSRGHNCLPSPLP